MTDDQAHPVPPEVARQIEEEITSTYDSNVTDPPAPPTEREGREESDTNDGLASVCEHLSDFRDAGGDPVELAVAIEWLIRLFIAQHEIEAHPNLRTHSPEEPADLAPKHDREAILSLIADDARRIEAGEPSVCAGCEKEIASRQHVYRCTECGLPFHLPCARVHFRDSANASPEEPDEVVCSTCGERRPRDPVGMRGRPEEGVGASTLYVVVNPDSPYGATVEGDGYTHESAEIAWEEAREEDGRYCIGALRIMRPIGQPLDSGEGER